jgi:hypothetical protein
MKGWSFHVLLVLVGVIAGLTISWIIWPANESSLPTRDRGGYVPDPVHVSTQVARHQVPNGFASAPATSLSVDQLLAQSSELPTAKKFRMIAEQVPTLSEAQLKLLIAELSRNSSFRDVMDLSSVAGEPLMNDDVEGFFRWIDTEFDEVERIDVLFEMMRNALPETVESIWTALRSVWPPEESEMMISHLMAHAAEVDPQSALQTSLVLFSDESLRFEAVTSVLDTWVQTDPRSALAAVLAMPESNLSDLLSASVLNGWYAENPVEMERVLQRGEIPEEFRKKGIAVAVQARAGGDPLAAAEWLAKFPPDVISEEAVVNLTTHLSLQHPEAALEWNNRIPRGPLRDINQFDIVSRWAVSDLAAATKFASQNPIADESLEQEFWLRFPTENR